MSNNIEIIEKDNKEMSIEYFYSLLKMVDNNKCVDISENVKIVTDGSTLRILDKDFERLWGTI